jgi:hypothetical protein
MLLRLQQQQQVQQRALARLLQLPAWLLLVV